MESERLDRNLYTKITPTRNRKFSETMIKRRKPFLIDEKKNMNTMGTKDLSNKKNLEKPLRASSTWQNRNSSKTKLKIQDEIDVKQNNKNNQPKSLASKENQNIENYQHSNEIKSITENHGIVTAEQDNNEFSYSHIGAESDSEDWLQIQKNIRKLKQRIQKQYKNDQQENRNESPKTANGFIKCKTFREIIYDLSEIENLIAIETNCISEICNELSNSWEKTQSSDYFSEIHETMEDDSVKPLTNSTLIKQKNESECKIDSLQSSSETTEDASNIKSQILEESLKPEVNKYKIASCQSLSEQTEESIKEKSDTLDADLEPFISSLQFSLAETSKNKTNKNTSTENKLKFSKKDDKQIKHKSESLSRFIGPLDKNENTNSVTNTTAKSTKVSKKYSPYQASNFEIPLIIVNENETVKTSWEALPNNNRKDNKRNNKLKVTRNPLSYLKTVVIKKQTKYEQIINQQKKIYELIHFEQVVLKDKVVAQLKEKASSRSFPQLKHVCFKDCEKNRKGLCKKLQRQRQQETGGVMSCLWSVIDYPLALVYHNSSINNVKDNRGNVKEHKEKQEKVYQKPLTLQKNLTQQNTTDLKGNFENENFKNSQKNKSNSKKIILNFFSREGEPKDQIKK